jgi:putative DNA-invertase from lambdoid prophage Rac
VKGELHALGCKTTGKREVVGSYSTLPPQSLTPLALPPRSPKGWTIFKEYADEGASGATTRRPALDQLMADARRRRFDVVCVAKLDRFGRSLKGLVLTLEELQSLGIAFVSINEGIDLSTSVGRLQLHILAALAQWERERIIERVRSGMARAKARGKRFGRPERVVPEATLASVRGLSVREAAKRLGISPATAHRWLSHQGPAKRPVQPSEILDKRGPRSGDLASHSGTPW